MHEADELREEAGERHRGWRKGRGGRVGWMSAGEVFRVKITSVDPLACSKQLLM